jgi:predicted transcriptional regulator
MPKEVSNPTESELQDSALQDSAFIATPEELRAIDAAVAAIDAGEIATDAEVQAAFAKFRAV